MHSQDIQSNSVIGSLEGKTANCSTCQCKSPSSPFGGPVRRLIGGLVLVVACGIAIDERVSPSETGSHQPLMQKADIIDDIIDIINDIINPPQDPEP